MKSSKFLIEFQCPQCGAPAVLEETDHLFSCEFCRVKSYLMSKVFRFVIPHAAEGAKNTVFFPYWRFKGMLFSCVKNGIHDRLVDVSYQAVPSSYFPASLGLRSQALKLRFVTPEMEGTFLKPSLSHDDVIQTVESNFSGSLPRPIFHQEFIGETLSLIYSPFYIDNKVIDAVLNRPVSTRLPEEFDISSFPGGRPDWKVKFVASLCPHCGWDLQGQRDSIALNCNNCNTMWYPGEERFEQIEFACFPEHGDNLIYLPFYRIQVKVRGLNLESYAHLVKLANLPKVVQKNWKNKPFFFWSPAFKVRPKDFLRFSSALTLSQPEGKVVSTYPKAPTYPVTLPFSEAAESLKLNLAGFVKPQRHLFPKLQEIDIKPNGFVLFFLPFQQRGSELTQPAYRMRINKNLLEYARNW